MRDRSGLPPFLRARCLRGLGGLLWFVASCFQPTEAAGDGGSGPARTVRLQCGETFAATLAEIDQQGSVTFHTHATPRVIAAEEVVGWGAFRDSDRAPQIVLDDGSWLVAAIRDLDAHQLRLDSVLWGHVVLPRESVRGIVFNPSPDPFRRDRARQQLLAERSEDQLYLENGDILSGQVQEFQLSDPDLAEEPDTLLFATQGRTVPLALENLTSVAFPSGERGEPPEEPRMMLGLQDGSRLFVRRLETSGPLRRLVLADDLVLETDPDWLWSEITALQPLGMGVRYVSDMELSGYRHIPLLERTRELGKDRNLRGGYLRSGGRLYLKGLAMPTASRVVCPLQGDYERFEAELALDDLAGRQGSVVFRVFLSDNAGGWVPAYESPPISGGDPPVSIAIDVTGAQALVLLAEMGARGDVLDYANWLNARLIR